MMKRRVVVTGTGLVIPNGIGTSAAWSNICAGIGGISRITKFDTGDYPVKIAGEVKNFSTEDYFEKKESKHLDLFTQFALVAAREAVRESGLDFSTMEPGRTGVITGCGMGSLPRISDQHEVALTKGYKRISPFFIITAIANAPSGHISMEIGSKGPNLSFSTACAAGTNAVGEAYRHIAYGMCDAIIAGGAEAVVCPLGLNGFSAMKALSTRNDDPATASRPFDKDRDGFVMSEGAGILVLEEYEHARRRRATIIAEITGYGLSSDAYHIAAPPESGEGAARAMAAALEDSGMAPENIDYINAHGTSTPLNDRCKTQAVKTVFKEHAYRLAISSTKSMTGHMLGAAGGIEAVFTALSIRDQIAPPTINLFEPSPECDLDYVPLTARKIKIRAALSNSFGFGGTNAVLVMKRFRP